MNTPTPRTDELANRLRPIAKNITATTAQTIITQIVTDILTLATELECELTAAREEVEIYKRDNKQLRKDVVRIGSTLKDFKEQRDRLAEALWSTLNQDHGSAIRAGILLRSLNIQSLNQTEP